MSIPLRFPGNALTRVTPGTRFEMFPSDAHMEAEELIEYYIGAPPSVLRDLAAGDPRGVFPREADGAWSQRRPE